MPVCNRARAIALGLAAVLAVGSASAAAVKAHRRQHVQVAVTAHPAKVVAVAAHSEKVCWRYYGGPKGGMWPGACPE
jgi:hypothetical protein